MSLQKQEVQCEKEVLDLLNAMLPLVSDIVSGKSAAQIAIDSFPAFELAVQEGAAALADVKADLSGSLMSAAVFIPGLLNALKKG